MQLACPKCKQVLKLGAVKAETVAITCPQCGHAFQAKIPRQPAASPAAPANPFDSLPPAAPAPAGTFRQPATPSRSRPTRSGKKAGPAKSFPVVPLVIGAFGLVLLTGLGFVGWSQREWIVGAGNAADDASETDPGQSSASLLDSIASSVFGSDTPETITDDFFAIQEQATEFQVSMTRYDESELDDLLDAYLDWSQESRELLQRGLGTEPRTLEQQEAFKDRYKTLVERSSERAKQHFETLGEQVKERMNRRLLDREVTESHPYSLMLIRFMQSGFCEVEPPEGEQSKIYVREVELLRRLNRFLAGVDEDGESSGDPARLEGFSDELVALAAERSSAEGGGMFVERGLGDAGEVHRSLTRLYFRQIERLHDTSKPFEDAKAIYAEAQDLFDTAKGYTPEKLRSQYADSKQGIKEPVKVAARPPAPAKPKAEPSQTKPHPTQPVPTKPAPAAAAESSQVKTQPGSASSVASNSRDVGSSKDGDDPPSSAGGSRPGFGGMPRGPGGFGPGGFRSPGGRQGGRPTESPGGRRFGGPSGFGGASGFSGQNGGSDRGAGGRDSRGGPGSVAPVGRFQGPDGATLLFKKTDDLPGTAKKWAAALGVKEYLVRSSFEQGELMIRWSGSMETLKEKIKFATVESLDESKRQIRLKLD